MALYNATDGPNWTNSSNWLSDSLVGQWYGVTTNDIGRVTILDLNNNQLSGEIPAELGSLSSLQELWLWQNQLSGEIPAELGNLGNLEAIRLAGNQLTGCVPGGLQKVLNNDFAALGLPFCGP